MFKKERLIIIFLVFILCEAAIAGKTDQFSELTRKAFLRFDRLSNTERDMLEAISKGKKLIVKPAFPTIDREKLKNLPKSENEFKEFLEEIEKNAQLMQSDPNVFRERIDAQCIRSEIIEWICFNEDAKRLVTNKGIQIEGAFFNGFLDLGFCEIPFPISLTKCSIMKLDLSYSNILAITLRETWCPSLQAYNLTVKGNLILDGINTIFGIDLRQSKIGGGLSFVGAKINSLEPNVIALDCVGIQVDDSVYLEEFFSRGKIRFVNAKIKNDLSFYKSNMTSDFDAMRSYIGGVLFIDNTKVEGRLSFDNSYIGSLECTKSNFNNKNNITFSGNHLKIEGDCKFVENFESQGAIFLQNAKVNGNVILGGNFINCENTAIQANGICIKGSLFLKNKFVAEGCVNLIGSEIGTSLECDGAVIKNEKGKTLFAQNLTVNGPVFLRNGFSSFGEVDIYGSEIKGGIDCSGGTFNNDGNTALLACNLKVAGDIYFADKFTTKGAVDISNSTIEGEVVCHDANLSNPTNSALTANNTRIRKNLILNKSYIDSNLSINGAKIEGSLVIDSLSLAKETKIDFRFANINSIFHDPNSWPLKGNLHLNGLTYDSIYFKGDTSEKGIEWVRLQESFHEQPYEQLVNYYKKNGKENKATLVNIQKAKDKIQLSDMSFPKKQWSRFLWIIGYGYKPLSLPLVSIIIVIITLGSYIFHKGYKKKSIRPKSKQTLEFNCLLYSIDLFVPIINFFEKEEYFITQSKCSGLLRWYRLFHIVSGWVLISILILGLTGIIKI